MDSTATPEPVPGPPAGESPSASSPAKEKRRLETAWSMVAIVLVTPSVWMEMTHLLGRAGFDVPFVLAALFAGGVLFVLLKVGLERNWQTSLAGWGLITACFFGSLIPAILAFRDVRASSMDKGVLSNAHLISATADQYFSDYGVSFVEASNLIGPNKYNYMKVLNTIANESYPTAYTQGMTITITGVAGLRTVTYSP